MELNTFAYFKDKGWSVDSFPALDSPKTLLMIFAAQEYIHDSSPIKMLIKNYPQSVILGCSTSGEIIGASVVDASIVVAVIKFQDTEILQGSIQVQSTEDSFEAGKYLAEQFGKENLRGLFILSDGLNINGSELIKGLNEIFPPEVVVTGGLAGDGSRFKHTWVICDNELKEKYVTAVGFYGDKIQIGHGSKGGWDGFGPERRITKSKGNVLYELDQKPALALYKEYLGDRAEGLPATGLLFPLAIRQNPEDKREIVRTILAVDEEEQTLTFAGDIPTCYFARLMRANFDRLIAGAGVAALAAKGHHADGPTLAVAISCVGRRLLLGEYTEEETESTLEVFPDGTKQIGFYSYGEISPHGIGRCDLHNQTMTLTTLSERS